MNHDRLHQLVTTAFQATLDRDAERAAGALAEIAASGDPLDMYAACCGLAEIGKRSLMQIYGAEAFDPGRGDLMFIQELQPGALADNPPEAFALRFLSAYCNDDAETAPALFRAALDAGPEAYVDSTASLLFNVAGIAKLALGQPGD